MRRRVTVLGVSSVWTIFAILHYKTPKKEHHKNQRPMGKIFKKVFLIRMLRSKLRLFPVYAIPKFGHFVVCVSMRKVLDHTIIFEKGMYHCSKD